jgi:DNA repair exonuclease SbcCD ATPase subunit
MPSLTERFSSIQQQTLRKLGQRDMLAKKAEELAQREKNASAEASLCDSSRKLLELFIRTTEVSIREYVEPVVTEALEFVFCQGLKFHLLFASRRNQVEVDFIIVRTADSEALYQKCIQNPTKHATQLEQLVKSTKHINITYGGAINQVLALVLRLVLLELLQVKGPVCLDEPTSAVGEEYSARVGQLISSLSQRFNRQYILITHSKTLAGYANKVYGVEQIAGVSRVVEDKS